MQKDIQNKEKAKIRNTGSEKKINQPDIKANPKKRKNTTYTGY